MIERSWYLEGIIYGVWVNVIICSKQPSYFTYKLTTVLLRRFNIPLASTWRNDTNKSISNLIVLAVIIYESLLFLFPPVRAYNRLAIQLQRLYSWKTVCRKHLSSFCRSEKEGSIQYINKASPGAKAEVLLANIPDLKDIRLFDAASQTGQTLVFCRCPVFRINNN